MNAVFKSTAAIFAASLAMPAIAATVWPDVDFEWYANVGRYNPAPAVVEQPAPRPGYIWSPAHWENRGRDQQYVAAHWVVDDYVTQLASYNHPAVEVVAR